MLLLAVAFGTCFLFADVGTSESLLLELLDLFVFFAVTGATLVGCLLLSSSEESDDEDSFVFLFAKAGDGGTTPFFGVVTLTGAEEKEF